MRFSASKEGAYTAASLDLPADVDVLNPDAELLQLTGSGLVEFELYVKQSRGYVDASLHTDFEERPDIIKIDGMFSPVRKVGYEQENMRIGQNATYERLVMDVVTDGSVTPKDAIMLAAKIAKSHFDFFEDMSDIAEKTEVYQEKKEEEKKANPVYTEFGDEITYKIVINNTTEVNRGGDPYNTPDDIYVDIEDTLPLKCSNVYVDNVLQNPVNGKIRKNDILVKANSSTEITIRLIVEEHDKTKLEENNVKIVLSLS